MMLLIMLIGIMKKEKGILGYDSLVRRKQHEGEHVVYHGKWVGGRLREGVPAAGMME